MNTRVTLYGVVIAVVVVAGTASAQVHVPIPVGPILPAPRIDPRFDAIERVLQAEGPMSPYFGGYGLGDGVRTEGVAALLRFDDELDPRELATLEASGVQWQRGEHAVVRVGHVYGAFVRFDALTTLASWPGLVTAEVAWHPVLLRPLEATGAELGAGRARTMPSLVATGEGAVVGNIDSGVDVLHPHMFRADGGAYDWIDTNGDGVFTPRVDHIDYDRDGSGAFNEVARVLDASEYGPDRELVNDDGELDVRRDWLFVDANGDGARNAGRAAGFTEFDPGYGEPMFVPDDANRNGRLDVGERVLLLGSSKVARFVTTERTYRRGQDMIDAGQASIADQFFHGTGVSSIVVGGHAPRERTGIAPGADLVMYAAHIDDPGSGWNDVGQLAAIQDATVTGVDVLLHEWTNPYTAPLDGGGNLEAAMSSAREAGVVQINPLGNMNLSQKHVELLLAPEASGELKFNVGAGFDGGNGVRPYASVYGSIYWRTAQQPVFVLRNPAGIEVTLAADGSIETIGNDRCQGTLSESPRGTRQLLVVVWNPNPDASVAQGDWTVSIAATQPDLFTGRIGDFWSGWSPGVRWLAATQDRGTAVYPATADAAFGVAAYAGRHPMMSDGTAAGELRNFSGRGPRIDGARLVDLAAPDDPFVAWGVSDAWVEAGVGRSWFVTFGGTSGAAPHVAGAVALMRSLDPDLSPDAIEQRLLATARRDAFTPDPLTVEAWGAGKLDVYAAVHQVSATPNASPVASLELVGEELSAEGSSDPDGDELQVRWDLDYDGTWDTDWTSTLTIPAPATDGPIVVRLEVRDGRGGTAGAVLRAAVSAPMEPGPPDMGETPPDAGHIDLVPTLVPPKKSCAGCSSTGGSSSWLGLFALLALLWRPRTRPKRAPPRPLTSTRKL